MTRFGSSFRRQQKLPHVQTLSQPVASDGKRFDGYDGAVAPVAIRGPWESVQSVSLLDQSRKALQGLALVDAIRLVKIMHS